MAFTKIEIYKNRLDKRYERLKEFSGKEFNKIRKFIERCKTEDDISEATERKFLDSFVMLFKEIKKIDTLKKKDLEVLKNRLKNGLVKSRFGQAYSDTSIREMQIILVRYLEFAYKNKFPDLRKWFIIKLKKKSPEILTEQEVLKLYKSCKNNAERFFIAVLFDSGFRIGEFLNIRFEDIIEPTSDFPYYRIDLKGEYSKTLSRNIGLYWKNSFESIKDFLEENKGEPKEPIFKKSYDAVRIWLNRLGKKVLNKRVNLHMLRKSSATFYASKLNRQELCYRFGWRFSSDVPDVYISRAGMKEEIVKDKFVNSQVQILEKQKEELSQKIGIAQDTTKKEIEEIKKLVEKLQNQILNRELIVRKV